MTGEGNAVQRVLLRDAVENLGGALIGERLWKEHRRWPMYSKFFDNQGALPHHVHHGPVHAANVGQLEKPEAYFFPVQANNHGGDFPYTFFGINPGTTRAQVKQALIRYGQLTHDEYFVSETAARAGVRIVNPSPTHPLVMLKHFGPHNPELLRVADQ